MPFGPAELRSPLGFVALFPQDLPGDLCIPFVLGRAFSQVTTLPPSPCLVWIFRHAPRPPFESLTPELRRVILPLRPALLGRRCGIYSAPRFVGFSVPTVQTQVKSHWKTVGFSREVQVFPCPSQLHVVCVGAGYTSLLFLT